MVCDWKIVSVITWFEQPITKKKTKEILKYHYSNSNELKKITKEFT